MIAGIEKTTAAVNGNKQQFELPAVVDRFEAKFTIPLAMVDRISSFIAPYCSMDAYSERAPNGYYRINSLYFDSPDFFFLRQRIFKAENRFNMRIRSYGDEPELPYYLEIKQRRGDAISKYRAKLHESDLDAALNGPGAVRGETDDNGANIDLFRRNLLTYNARPVVLVQYQRRAFVSNCDEYARVTFDIGLRYMPQSNYIPIPREEAMLPCDAQTLFDGGCSVILELKCYADYVPLWMVDLVRTFQLRRRGFSKYTNCIKPVLNSFRHGGAFFMRPVITGE